MPHFTQSETHALKQLLTTITTSDEYPELKEIINGHDLIKATYRDERDELIRQDIKHIIMTYGINNVNMSRHAQLIDDTVKHIRDEYDYGDYNDYIANYIDGRVNRRR